MKYPAQRTSGGTFGNNSYTNSNSNSEDYAHDRIFELSWNDVDLILSDVFDNAIYCSYNPIENRNDFEYLADRVLLLNIDAKLTKYSMNVCYDITQITNIDIDDDIVKMNKILKKYLKSKHVHVIYESDLKDSLLVQELIKQIDKYQLKSQDLLNYNQNYISGNNNNINININGNNAINSNNNKFEDLIKLELESYSKKIINSHSRVVLIIC